MADIDVRQNKRRRLGSSSSRHNIPFTGTDQLHGPFQFSKSAPSEEVQNGTSPEDTNNQA